MPDILMSEQDEILSCLTFQLAMGADEAIADVPRNWLEQKQKPVRSASLEPPVNRATPAVPVTPAIQSSRQELPTSQEEMDAARNLARQAQTLDDLKEAIRSFNGSALRKTATNLVFGDGNPQADLMVIGEAPGKDEDRQGLPFVGVSGRLLDRMLAAIGYDRQTFYITNVLNWRPPGNRKPSPQEIELFTPFIQRHIGLVSPKVLLLVGDTPTKALLGLTGGITRTRGRWKNFSFADPALSVPDVGLAKHRPESQAEIPAIPTFHPAFLLRQPAQKRLSWQDMLSLKDRLSV